MKKFKNATMNDIFAGIIVAFISIPISMGYAQVAGLPMVYGLYGSLVPILVFSLFTTSHDFVFGVDAAPAALTGSALATLGITAGTKEAMQVVPVIALMVALWLIFFSIINSIHSSYCSFVRFDVTSAFAGVNLSLESDTGRSIL